MLASQARQLKTIVRLRERWSMTPQQTQLLNVGNVCTQWSYLEYLLGNAISFLLKANDTHSEIILRDTDIFRKARIASELAESVKTDSELQKCLDDILKEIPNLSSERNLIVHGVYFSKKTDHSVIARAYRGKYAGSPQLMPTTRTEKLGADILALSLRLISPMERLGIKTD